MHPAGRQFLGGRANACRIAPGDVGFHPLPRQAAGDHRAYAGAAARDERGLAGEREQWIGDGHSKPFRFKAPARIGRGPGARGGDRRRAKKALIA